MITKTPKVPMLLGGQCVHSDTQRFGTVFNPSTGDAIAQVPLCTPDDVDRAVQGAQAAFRGWSETPVVERARVMFRYRELLDRHLDELAVIVTREHGKTRSEARAS